jgi:hypothetical protein
LFRCKMIKGSLVNTHVLKMTHYFKKLGQLGFVIDHELSIDLILQSKHRSLLGASRMTSVLVIIMTRKTTIGGTTKTNLQSWRLKSLLKLLFHVYLWLNKGKVNLQVINKVGVVALIFSNELILKFDNCYFILALFKNIVSISEWIWIYY